MIKTRLDVLLVDKGYFASREAARRAVLAGQVKIGEVVFDKPGVAVDPDCVLNVKPASPYVSRGADKLVRALDVFHLDVTGRVALDAGASTGGFTDVLLTRGASRVIAVDVGYGQLAWRLRRDPRVDVFERVNIRHLRPADLPAVPDLITADLSFISLTKVAENLMALAAPVFDFVFLIKPQFEAGKGQVGKGGIIREASRHGEILTEVLLLLTGLGLGIAGLTYSPITGADGNIEFLGWFQRGVGSDEVAASAKNQPPRNDGTTRLLIEAVVAEAHVALDKKALEKK